MKVVNAQEEKVKDISEYSLVAVGSGVACGSGLARPRIF